MNQGVSRVRRLLPVVATVAALSALFLFGLLRGSPDRDIPSNFLGREVPNFDLPLYERYMSEFGPRLTLDEVRGRPMVINFWASWCGPCYEEAPHLQRAHERYGDEVLFIGIQTQDRDARAAGRAFIDQFGLSFPNVFDGDSRTSIAYGLFGVPETFFVHADGTLQHKYAGPVTETILSEQIGALRR
ncbi:MAG: TlpA family protein disulfide reductase [Trueperaceae bacterium]|nr:MAG: TlpA family protein disulfide reductase [Trueperaceae bacterium]